MSKNLGTLRHILQAQSDGESPHGCYIPHTAKTTEDRHVVARLVYCFYTLTPMQYTCTKSFTSVKTTIFI